MGAYSLIVSLQQPLKGKPSIFLLAHKVLFPLIGLELEENKELVCLRKVIETYS